MQQPFPIATNMACPLEQNLLPCQSEEFRALQRTTATMLEALIGYADMQQAWVSPKMAPFLRYLRQVLVGLPVTSLHALDLCHSIFRVAMNMCDLVHSNDMRNLCDACAAIDLELSVEASRDGAAATAAGDKQHVDWKQLLTELFSSYVIDLRWRIMCYQDCRASSVACNSLGSFTVTLQAVNQRIERVPGSRTMCLLFQTLHKCLALTQDPFDSCYLLYQLEPCLTALCYAMAKISQDNLIAESEGLGFQLRAPSMLRFVTTMMRDVCEDVCRHLVSGDSVLSETHALPKAKIMQEFATIIKNVEAGLAQPEGLDRVFNHLRAWVKAAANIMQTTCKTGTELQLTYAFVQIKPTLQWATLLLHMVGTTTATVSATGKFLSCAADYLCRQCCILSLSVDTFQHFPKAKLHPTDGAVPTEADSQKTTLAHFDINVANSQAYRVWHHYTRTYRWAHCVTAVVLRATVQGKGLMLLQAWEKLSPLRMRRKWSRLARTAAKRSHQEASLQMWAIDKAEREAAALMAVAEAQRHEKELLEAIRTEKVSCLSRITMWHLHLRLAGQCVAV